MLATRASRTDMFGQSSRFYEIETENGIVKYPSVTTILSCVAKPGLIPWAAREERKLVTETAVQLYLDAPASPKMSKAAFLSTLDKRLGETRAHVRILDKANDIGSQIHALIEWNLRKTLGQVVGPEPPITDDGALAFTAYQKWADKVDLKPELIEQTVWSHAYKYAGTADFVATMDDGTGTGERVRVLGDWKSSKALYPESSLQVAAYATALQEMGHANDGLGALVVRLPKTVKETEPETKILTPHDVRMAALVFRYVKQVWDWQELNRKVPA